MRSSHRREGAVQPQRRPSPLERTRLCEHRPPQHELVESVRVALVRGLVCVCVNAMCVRVCWTELAGVVLVGRVWRERR